jgi:two-component system, NtrC family, response regulator
LQALNQPDALAGLITRDTEMLRISRTIERIASSNATVLLLGESGTGKEVLSQGVHTSSKRSGRFVAINCAAIPENLLESELFGYEKGAFTGATKSTPGKIESAHNGTLMLDEIGDLPHSLQAKLLRFLQERTIERLGGRQEIPVDVRVVCATHQNLKSLIAEGRFREDLYYRLAEIVINIPPLRARNGDAALLAHAFLRRFAQEQRRNGLGFSEEALRAIELHAWPGNVRELLNALKRASIMADSDRLSCDDLGLPPPPAADGSIDGPVASDLDLRTVREAAERQAIGAALSRANDNMVKAAEILGVSRPTLYDLMRRLAIK